MEDSGSQGEYSARVAKVEGIDRLGEDLIGSVWLVGTFSLGEYSEVGHEYWAVQIYFLFSVIGYLASWSYWVILIA